MEVVKHFLLTILYGAFSLSVPVHAQDQSGFISIDCGITEQSSYKDEITGINYISDAGFIETGVNGNISSEIDTTNVDQQYFNLRSFPDGKKNCYKLKPKQGKNNRYLIRAGFMYGNYDKKSDVPRFDLYLGVNWWDTIRLDDASTSYTTEIFHVPSSDYIGICLVNTGFGTPFISVLELRLLSNNTYMTGSALLFARRDVGSTSNSTIRFPNDVYDRTWSPLNFDGAQIISTSSAVESPDNNYQVPSIVMETAVVPLNNSNPFGFYWRTGDPTSQFYVYMHIAEIEVPEPNQTREFNTYINDEFWHGPVTPLYLKTTTINSKSVLKGKFFRVIMNTTKNSTLPPLINAYEIYLVKEFLQSETYQEDVDAIVNIISYYKVKRYWQGDPCAPKVAIWDGLNCSYDGYDPPRIVSLDLSSSGLTGEIAPYISNLTMIQYLDLSNNSLTGTVPNFLAQLPYLRVLNLEENQLWGSVPHELIERSKNETLSLNVQKNPQLCSSDSCKRKSIVPVIATIGSVFVFLLIAAAVFWILKRRKQGELNEHNRTPRLKERQFAYSEVINITHNLERTLGKGKFGTVYHGYLDDTQVAVKIFSPSCVHDSRQFRAAAKLLTRVDHRFLTTYLGYCDEGTDKVLIYEYMANGSLEESLTDRSTNFLSWLERLQIAMDVAQGLEHLHNGCNPSIIHGNLKPTNILLNDNFQAKLVEFGLSKVFTIEGGTTEYTDPEYYVTNKLTERSDVFSFGVVLLAIITSQPVMANNKEKTNIIEWVSSLLGKGDIKSIIDSRLQGDYHIDSVWKAVEIAMACVSKISMRRPTMTQVVMELNQCLAMEINRTNSSGGTIELVSVNLSTGLSRPIAR